MNVTKAKIRTDLSKMQERIQGVAHSVQVFSTMQSRTDAFSSQGPSLAATSLEQKDDLFDADQALWSRKPDIVAFTDDEVRSFARHRIDEEECSACLLALSEISGQADIVTMPCCGAQLHRLCIERIRGTTQ